MAAFFNQAFDAYTRGEPGDRASLYALVLKRRATASVVFWDVTDGPYTGQVAASREVFSDEGWQAIRAVRRAARLRLSGIIGLTTAGTKTVFLDSLPIVQDYSFPQTLAAVEPYRRRIGASIFVARLRDLAEQSLRDLGYLRLDVRILAPDWYNENGLQPLQALYPGFGRPMFLVPSPSPQLITALIGTGHDKVFTSSTAFTSSYREPEDGSEVSLVMAKTINSTLEELVSDSTTLLGSILAGVGADESFGDPQTWSQRESEWPPNRSSDAVINPEIRLYRNASVDGGDVIQLARCLFPQGLLPLEIALETAAESVSFGTITLYLERLLPTVEHLPIRRLHAMPAELVE